MASQSGSSSSISSTSSDESWRNSTWDPLSNNDTTPPTAAALRRIQKEIASYMKEPIDGIHFVMDDRMVNVIHALVLGPPETPYEGGFFYFIIRLPFNYPFKPPLVKLMTTGGGKVRFNPNLYADGKVCLSILGTWPGPAWSPNLTIRTVLLSIQSLMCKDPYFNEPGYESQAGKPTGQKATAQYNANIRYETMRIAVLDMMAKDKLESSQMPQALKNIMQVRFTSMMDFYLAVLLQHQDQDDEQVPASYYRILQEHFNLLFQQYGNRATGHHQDGPTGAKQGRFTLSWFNATK